MKYDFSNMFNTQLQPMDELKYQLWLNMQSQLVGRDLSQDTYDYDMRGYFINGGYNQDLSGAHLPDTYKKPNHPTFSDQSIYSGVESPLGTLVGGKWSEKDGKTEFTPSKEMLEKTHPIEMLSQYMKEREPDVKLNNRGYQSTGDK
jgi:hypothetical protein